MSPSIRHHLVAVAVCAPLVAVEFFALHAVAGPRTAAAVPAAPPCVELPAPVELVPVRT